MLKNTLISLSPDSSIRTEALNTIKYTLLLNYNAPSYSEDPNTFIEQIMMSCQQCCVNLFRSNSIPTNSYAYYFFGSNSSLIEPARTYFNMGSIPPVDNKYFRQNKSTENFYFHKMILEHCIMSCYHAVLTELYDNGKTTDYKIVNRKKDVLGIGLAYDGVEDHISNNAGNKEKSSLASTFTRISNAHLKVLPMFTELHSLEQFSDLWCSICFNLNAGTLKCVFDKTSKRSVYYKFTKIQEISNLFLHGFSEEKMKSERNIPYFLYHLYLSERILNTRLFISVCSLMDYIEKNQPYSLNQFDLRKSLSAIKALPNVFSRQYMLAYAMLHIDNNTASNRDYWHFHNIHTNDIIMTSSRMETRIFDLYKWKEQLDLFTAYISRFVIPVYEWCFTNMLFESIETKFHTQNHNTNLNTAKKILENYMKKNYIKILRPYCNPNDSIIKNYFTDIISSASIAAHLPYNNGETLIRDFFEPDYDLELNLSTSLQPEYFRHSQSDLPNPNITRIQDFYIDLLRYNHWQ